jgi:hypothetical protein
MPKRFQAISAKKASNQCQRGRKVNRRSRSRRKRKRNGIPSRQYDEEYELVNLRIFCELALSKI